MSKRPFLRLKQLVECATIEKTYVGLTLRQFLLQGPHSLKVNLLIVTAIERLSDTIQFDTPNTVSPSWIVCGHSAG